MGATTKTIVSDVLPVAIIIVLLFFFLETFIGKKLLKDLWNTITKGLLPSDKGSTGGSNNQNNNQTIVDSSGSSSGGGQEPTIPPPDVSNTLNVKNTPNTSTDTTAGNDRTNPSGSGAGTSKPYEQPNPYTPPVPKGTVPVNAVSAHNPFDASVGIFQSAPQSTPKQSVAPRVVNAPVQNVSKPLLNTSTPLKVTFTPNEVPISTSEKVPNPLPQQPNLLQQIETSISSFKFPTNLLGLNLPKISLPFANPFLPETPILEAPIV